MCVDEPPSPVKHASHHPTARESGAHIRPSAVSLPHHTNTCVRRTLSQRQYYPNNVSVVVEHKHEPHSRVENYVDKVLRYVPWSPYVRLAYLATCSVQGHTDQLEGYVQHDAYHAGE